MQESGRNKTGNKNVHMIRKVTDTTQVKSLFEGWEETMIWSCLQGVMGDLYTDDSGDSAASSKASSKISGPETAKAVLGDFIFLAGKPSEELLLYQPPCRAAKKAEFQILVPKDAGWERLIEKVYGSRAEKITRYGIKKEPDAWDGEGRERLQEMAAALPEGYELRLIDQKLYDQCRQQEWSRDLVSQFPNYESYRQWGLGAAVLHGTELVCGASSYSRYREGIEIEIDTKPEHRRRGLARACAARLILECLDRGLYPSWDAHTEISAELAEKLGYHRGEEYTAYLVQPCG